MQIESDPEVTPPKICVVIPAYKVSKHILGLLAKIGPEVGAIYVVDDSCPEKTGELVIKYCADSRVHVIYHLKNQGVGGAVMTGYRSALKDGAEIIVKLDGDGQMDPRMIPRIIRPIVKEQADYTKGNRFFNIERIREMPILRILGNLALSFFSKLSSGYWQIFDPNNGFTAINSKTAEQLPLNKISSRYFFESDMLFRLNLMRAVVVDVPMDAFYGDETSNLRLRSSVFEFAGKHIRNAFKRILYSYYLREFNLASIELPLGTGLCIFGLVVGIRSWMHSFQYGIATQPGTLILIAMSFLSGLQLLLGFFAYDIANVPREAISGSLHGTSSDVGQL